jgi:DNA-directed RNA polymerase specialized sigma24 family protein
LVLDGNQLVGDLGDVGSPEPAVCPFESSNEDLARKAATASSESLQKVAFDELFRRMWRTTVEWAHNAGAITQHRAEDAATQAWFKAWKYRTRFDSSKGCYGTWLGTIVRNETFDILKSQRKEVPVALISDEQVAAEPAAVADPELTGLDFVFEAFEALRREKPEFAKVVTLKAQGYPERQICEMLGMPSLGTVGSRLSRSKQFIAGWLAERGVVYLPEGAIGTIHPMGLVPLCRSGEGVFYSFSPLAGLFVLPAGASAPPGSTAVCEGFFVTVWSYPLDDFEVTIGGEGSGEKAIFRWKEYVVHEANDLSRLLGV